ncbi:MAG: hypothetical protein DRJ40_04810 [Thermoprotei archaeon]|nr:MAG: hypothetical protein DRJ40_04715 [Thermoprotei archaeon]RLE56724.1 MAG: hypothetical protein DRJ40_04810 [Thermoprotei archaeon]
MLKPLVIAHACNSLGRVAKCISQGANVIEIDVYSYGGELIAYHPPDPVVPVSRVKRFIESIRYSVKRSRAPKLRDLLSEVLKYPIGIWLDLKVPRIEDSVCKLVMELGISDERLYFSSAYHYSLRVIKELLPKSRTFISLSERPVDPYYVAKCAQADGVSIRIDFLDRELVEQLHTHGIKVVVWTLNDEGQIINAVKLGVDGIVTDIPELVKRLLSGY